MRQHVFKMHINLQEYNIFVLKWSVPYFSDYRLLGSKSRRSKKRDKNGEQSHILVALLGEIYLL